MNLVMFSSKNLCWKTPDSLYAELNKEFNFDDDPCPESGIFGLDRSWGKRTFVNPPYGRFVGEWVKKASEESERGSLVVMLLAARTDTAWFHDYVLTHAKEVRFIRGRLKFGDGTNSAPFPSMIVIFSPAFHIRRRR